MASCKNCGATLRETTLHCDVCDHPIEIARDELLEAYKQIDSIAEELNAPSLEIQLVCPHCKEQSLTKLPDSGWLRINCGNCSLQYKSLLATVRACGSRGSQRDFSREYSVRVQFEDQESQLNFDQTGDHRIELRARDRAAFSYLDEELIVIQNLTINQYFILKQTRREFYELIWGGLLLLAGIFLILFMFS